MRKPKATDNGAERVMMVLLLGLMILAGHSVDDFKPGAHSILWFPYVPWAIWMVCKPNP